MTDLALQTLYLRTVARFASEAAAASVEPPIHAFGWRKPFEQETTPRIIWVPGDDGAVGELGPPVAAGGSPRALHSLEELFTVYAVAHDPTGPEDELKQYAAARLLFDSWLRVVTRVAAGLVEVRSITWVDDKNVRRHGAAIRVVATISAVIPDVPLTYAATPASAEETASLLDQSETATIEGDE